MATGERITKPELLMLGDIVHFTNAALKSNRTRDYKVVGLRFDSIDVQAKSTFIDGGRFTYTILARQLEELGTEIVYT